MTKFLKTKLFIYFITNVAVLVILIMLLLMVVCNSTQESNMQTLKKLPIALTRNVQYLGQSGSSGSINMSVANNNGEIVIISFEIQRGSPLRIVSVNETGLFLKY